MSQLYEYFDVTGGGQTLSGYAFPDVHKFDASSFYNWEQDNLPVLDLEMRSNVLRQYLGLTDVTGVTLTVSADAPKSASALGVYQTVQDALEVVPRRLRFPLLIEICDFGNLGDLNLADIHCEGDGALQIECRQYAPSIYRGFVSGTESVADTGPSGVIQSMMVGHQDSASVALAGTGFHTDTATNISNASSTNLGISCSSLEGWSRNGRLFNSVRPDSQKETQCITFSPQYDNEVASLFPGGVLPPSGSPYSYSAYSTTEESTIALDVSPRTQNGTGQSLIEERRVAATADNSVASWWGAYFNKIEIKNCSKIKLKNICVDSASGLDSQYPRQMSYLCDTGISITNSNILLENIAVCRVRKTGINVQDSTVSLKNAFVIHRVYERNLDGTRPSEGVGLFATDSNIVFDTDSSNLIGRIVNSESIRSISKCGHGIVLNNSLLTGGYLDTGVLLKNAGGQTQDIGSTRLYIHNTQTGIKLTNSVYDLSGRTEVFCNINGIEAYQSNLTFQQFSVDSNQEKGFYLNHSNLFYGKDSDTLGAGDSSLSGATKPAFACDYNGINIHADKNSSIAPHEDVESVPLIARWGGKTDRVQSGAGKWIMSNHGTYGLGAYKAPNIILNNNSDAEFTHLAVAFNGAAAGVAGACVQVSENSQAVFRGTGRSATCMGSYGDVTLKSNWTTAAVAALDNSEVVFTGPTKIARAGVGVLAQNNSRAAFGPPTQDHTVWTPAYDRFQLSSTANHTTVDIHANRSCLVANEKSLIEIKSLGGSSLDAANSTDTSQTFDASNTFVESTSGSYIRFSPNGFTEQLAASYYGADSFNLFDRDVAAFTNPNHQNVTTGGMCVRAVGASKVDVNMTNFRIGNVDLPGQVSGVCYNYNGTGCEHTDLALSGIAASPAFNICDLVTSCCDETPTVSTDTTTASTPATTASTSTTATGITVDPPTIEPPTPTWEANILETVVDMGQEGNNVQNSDFEGVDYTFSCVGSRIHMWNIADTSRMHAANLLLNGNNPQTECINNSFHGPTGRWANGAACDYYGKLGFAASALTEKSLGSQVDGFYNLGVFRVIGSHRGYLKTYSEVDYQGRANNSQMTLGGSPMDQVNSQGYQTMFDLAINTPGAEDTLSYHAGLEPGSVSGAEPVFGRGLAGERGEPGKINGVMTHARMIEGIGMKWDEGELHPIFPFPPLHLGWQGYIRNWLDESAANVFANARHGASKKVNLLSIYRSSTSSDIGGEGRDTSTGNPTFGVGVRSLNMFDLNRLV